MAARPAGRRRTSLYPFIGAVVVCLVSTGATLIAAIIDLQALRAVATPFLYAWLVICVLCTGGLFVARDLWSQGHRPPVYFWIALALGVAGGLSAVPDALRVLGKDDESPIRGLPQAAVDWRAQTITDAVFDGRNLRRAQARNAVLRHVDLSGSNLAEADLRGAKLHDVDISRANFCGADLRGADLSGAHGVDAVTSWAYTFYDSRTKLPSDLEFVEFAGPIEDTDTGLLYMCTPNQTRRVDP